jgi:hypothetical protein
MGCLQYTGLFGALRLKDLPIIQINPYGVFFDFFGASLWHNQYGPFDKLRDRIDYALTLHKNLLSPLSIINYYSYICGSYTKI